MAGLLAVVAVCGIATAAPALAATTAPLAVATTYLPPGTAQTSYSAQLAATGGTKPYTWSISAGTLPAGLTLHQATGAITGKPTVTGPDSFTVAVTDSESTPAMNTAPETITVTAPPLSVTTTSLPGGTAGVAYSAKLAATGGISPYTWSLSGGSLPEGLTVHPNGTISGTPKAGGSASFTVEAADSDTPAKMAPASLSITIGVASLVVTTGASLPSAVSGRAYSVKLAGDGGITPYAWSLTSGSLPAGLTLRKNGTIDGTPSSSGSSSFSVQVTDAQTPAASAGGSFTLDVAPALSIEAPSPPIDHVGDTYDLQLQADGGTAPYAWSLASGSLPPGLSIDPSTGAITGTLQTAGPYPFTVQATDAENPAATATVSLTITVLPPAPTIGTMQLPRAVIGVAYSATVTATGGIQPYTWSTIGSLPAGLTLDPGTGVISGTPNGGPGEDQFYVQVTDSEGVPASEQQSLTIFVVPPLTVQDVTPPPATLGDAYDLQLQATGGFYPEPYTWALVGGSLPQGLSIDSQGLIDGTPVGATPGPYTFTVQVVDSFVSPQDVATKTLTISLGEAELDATTTSLPQAVDGVPYTATLTATGGAPPYSWSIEGSLPPGLSLDPSTGVISGTPAAADLGQTYTFMAVVEDSAPDPSTDGVSLSIQVISPNG